MSILLKSFYGAILLGCFLSVRLVNCLGTLCIYFSLITTRALIVKRDCFDQSQSVTEHRSVVDLLQRMRMINQGALILNI